MAPEQDAEQAARLTLAFFDVFDAEFRAVTRRASRRFADQDWAGGRRDSSERLDLYESILERCARELTEKIGARARVKATWAEAKRRYAALIAGRYDLERAETFFNSVTRKMLETAGIDRAVEFFYPRLKRAETRGNHGVHRTYRSEADHGADGATGRLLRRVLADFSFGVDFEDIERDAERVAREIDLRLWPLRGDDGEWTLDVVTAPFYRNKCAYIVGRIDARGQVVPLVLPLLHGERGIYVDAVLLQEAQACIVFSFAYSYFHVDIERYDALIDFLRSIMPCQTWAELYTSLGYNRHGKTEFYRTLHRFVHDSRQQFRVAPGLEGAVMIVFTLADYDFVFKVIKDRPCFLRSRAATRKVITRPEVRRRYEFVSHRDHAGRMVDTQEFENLRFRTWRFSAQLLREFRLAAGQAVDVGEEFVTIRHLYVQRKVTPLPLYLQAESDPEAIRHVLVDFGFFLKDVAASGVFPCDLFNTWNYGVTHWSRVVLYDYDDVAPLEKVSFREKPAPRHALEELAPEENWIVAGPDDFFMDELERYSGVPEPLRGVFRAVHADLYRLEFWSGLKAQLERGVIPDVIPYDRGRRFGRAEPAIERPPVHAEPPGAREY